jgi:adenylylsulfate kinase-like enzyme
MLKTKKQLYNNIKSYNTKKNIHKQQTIIHISGTTGSGKTTLGNKLKERDKELLNYKTKYYYSLALNVGLVGYTIYRLVRCR